MRRASTILLSLALASLSASALGKGKDAKDAAPVCAASCDATCEHCCTTWTIQATCDDGSIAGVEGTHSDGHAAARVAADLEQRSEQCSGGGEVCARVHLVCKDDKLAHWRAACSGPLPGNAATAAAADVEHADVLAQALALALVDAQQALTAFSARPDLKSSAQKRAKALVERLPAERDQLASAAQSAAPAKLLEHASADLREARQLVADPKSIDPHYQEKLDKAERDRQKAAERDAREQQKAADKAARDQKLADEKATRDQKLADEKAARAQKAAEAKAAHDQAAAEKAAAAAAVAAAAAQHKQEEDAAALDEAQKSRTAAGVTVSDADRKAYDAIVLADRWLAQPNLDPKDKKDIKSARDKLAATRADLAKLHADLVAAPPSDAKKAKSAALKQRVRAKELSHNVDKHYDELGVALRRAAGR